MRASAQANLERVRRGEPLVGHMLPYVAAENAEQLGLPFSPNMAGSITLKVELARCRRITPTDTCDALLIRRID